MTGAWSEGFFRFGGLVLVMSLHVFPFLMTMLKNAMLNIPASLEESGAVFGTGFWLRLRKIFAPLLTGNYAIGALLVFVKTLSEYGTPYTLERRIGFYVFTTDIHRCSTTAPIDFGRSACLSSILVCICMAMWLLQNYITGKNSYRLVRGLLSRRERRLREHPRPLGPQRPLRRERVVSLLRGEILHSLFRRLHRGRAGLRLRPHPGAAGGRGGAGLRLRHGRNAL